MKNFRYFSYDKRVAFRPGVTAIPCVNGNEKSVCYKKVEPSKLTNPDLLASMKMLLDDQKVARREERKERKEEFERLIALTDKHIDTTKEEIEEVTRRITIEHRKTRDDLLSRYHKFGKLMVVTTALLLGMFTMLVVEPLDIHGGFKALTGLIVSVVSGLYIDSQYQKDDQHYSKEETSS